MIKELSNQPTVKPPMNLFKGASGGNTWWSVERVFYMDNKYIEYLESTTLAFISKKKGYRVSFKKRRSSNSKRMSYPRVYRSVYRKT